MLYNINNPCNSMEALKCAAINKQAFIFSKNMACMSITSPQHTCLMVCWSRVWIFQTNHYLLCDNQRIYMEKCDVGLEASANVGYPKAWHTDCRNYQWDPPNSFYIPLIKRLSLPPSQFCHSALAWDCFHIFFELLSFIFYHIFLAVSFIFNT